MKKKGNAIKAVTLFAVISSILILSLLFSTNSSIAAFNVNSLVGASGSGSGSGSTSAKTYTVVYNGNGSTGGSTASSLHTVGIARNLTQNGYTRSYVVSFNSNGGSACSNQTATYTFNGWNTAANGSGTSYADRASVTNLSTTNGATVTLYAKWTGGAITLPTPTKTGYAVGG